MHSTSSSSWYFSDPSPDHVRSLARFFALKCAQDRELPLRPLSADAEDLLAAYEWHGNLSAMEATIRRAAIMADGGKIGPETIRLPGGPSAHSDEGADESHKLQETAVRALLGRTISDVECSLILMTLECCLGHRTQAAEILGISVRTLRNKLKEYARIGIRIPQVCEGKRAKTSPASHQTNGEAATAGGR